MQHILFTNARIVNEGRTTEADVLIKNGRIEKIGSFSVEGKAKVIDAQGSYLLPGLIDDQVHFREPGLTHKATIGSEARAAVAGGTTSFMEMPNTLPNALSQQLLQDKYDIAARSSLANYSFYMGCGNENLEEALRTDPATVCGLKIFMGSSTGNMLVDNPTVLESYFAKSPMLIATHCEDEATIRANVELFKEIYGANPPAWVHPLIRNVEACVKSSDFARRLAQKHGTRLHILHISTGDEAEKMEAGPIKNKKITAEACVHHLWFTAADYERLGNQIKCNPAIKEDGHRQRILQALLNDRLDVIATDHAPHTWPEKQENYWKAPSGLPLVQHSLLMMLDFVQQGKISLEKVVEKTSHAVADCFQIAERGYIREGYWADLVLVQSNKPYQVTEQNILYKCGWSPLLHHTFSHSISHTVVSGHLAYENGQFHEEKTGQRLTFNR
jgi:dihydroorotase